MIATARVKLDYYYFDQQYDDWLHHRAKYKPYEPWFYSLFTIVGIAICFLYLSKPYIGGLIALYGGSQLITSLTSKRRWIRARLHSIDDKKIVDMEFDNERIVSRSTNGSSELLYSAFTAFTLGSNGIFLVPDNGVSIYIPKATLEPENAYDDLVDILTASIGSKHG